MPRHDGASHWHDGAMSKKSRTRRARKQRGRKLESIKARVRARRSQP